MLKSSHIGAIERNSDLNFPDILRPVQRQAWILLLERGCEVRLWWSGEVKKGYCNRIRIQSNSKSGSETIPISADDPRICDEPLEAGQMPDAQGGRGQHLKVSAILSTPGKFIHRGFLAMLKGRIIRSLGNFIDPRFIFRLNHEFMMRYIYGKDSQIEKYSESERLKAFLVFITSCPFVEGSFLTLAPLHVNRGVVI